MLIDFHLHFLFSRFRFFFFNRKVGFLHGFSGLHEATMAAQNLEVDVAALNLAIRTSAAVRNLSESEAEYGENMYNIYICIYTYVIYIYIFSCRYIHILWFMIYYNVSIYKYMKNIVYSNIYIYIYLYILNNKIARYLLYCITLLFLLEWFFRVNP